MTTPNTLFKRPQIPIPSSSPAFATPLHPINPRRTGPPIPAPNLQNPQQPATILPILLTPNLLRPLAFRTFTKKHNLTLSSSALAALASFVGKHCGSGWREDGLAEGVLEEAAKLWKKEGGETIVRAEDELFRKVLKILEGCMHAGKVVPGKSGLSRQSSFAFTDVGIGQNDGQEIPRRPGLDSQTSFGMSSLGMEDAEDEEDVVKDPREWLKLVNAFEQPKLVYNPTKKNFERSSIKPSFFPPPASKTDFFRQRYHIVHQRILRHESFQTPSIPGAQRSGSNGTFGNKITPISNLLGRSGSSHLLLGLLAVSPTGTLALSDLTGTIALDLQHATPFPDRDSACFAPGMIVLVEGMYQEDYSQTAESALGNTGGIGGTIGGKFFGSLVAHPPCERRNASLGIQESEGAMKGSAAAAGPAFGWTDFLGVGSERAIGSRMRRLQSKIMGAGSPHEENTKIVIAAEINADNPLCLSALRTLLKKYASLPSSEYPIAFVLIGNFYSLPVMAGASNAGSIEYKEAFDSLASVLSEFPQLIARTTMIFVPGDNDAWLSSFSAGASVPLPRKGIPEMFTNRVRRVMAEANREVGGAGRRKQGEVIWASNPSRLTWFGCAGEMAIIRDNVLGRLRRTSLYFKAQEGEESMDSKEDSIHQQEERSNEVNTSEDVNGQISTQTNDEESHARMDIDTETILNDQQSIPQHETTKTTTTTKTNNPLRRKDSHQQQQQNQSSTPNDTKTARLLTKTLLDQSHLSPFPLDKRPIHWDYAHTMSLYPLPSALVIADTEAPAFALNYMGCAVMNPGSILADSGSGYQRGNGRRGLARWVEFDVLVGKGVVRVE